MCDFITSHRPEAIRSWNKSTLLEWTDFLSARGVTISSDRSTSHTEKVIELLHCEKNQGVIHHHHDYASVVKSVDKKEAADPERQKRGRGVGEGSNQQSGGYGDAQLATYIMEKVATTSGDSDGDDDDLSTDENSVNGNHNAHRK